MRFPQTELKEREGSLARGQRPKGHGLQENTADHEQTASSQVGAGPGGNAHQNGKAFQ